MIRILTYMMLFSLMLLSACSQNTALTASSKAAYITYLNSLSDQKLEAQLINDADYLSSVLDSLEGFQFYYSIGFGFSGGSGDTPIDTARAFSLPVREVIFQDFHHPERKLYFVQSKALPESAFRFSSGYAPEAFEALAVDDLTIDIEKIYCQNRIVSAGDLKLQSADSLSVKVSYRYPVHFDTLVINNRQKKPLAYEKYAIEIDRFGKKKAVFFVPLELSEKIIDYRGVTESGVLVKSNSFSKFPIIAIDVDIKKNLQMLGEALQSGNKDRVLAQLEKSPEKILEHIQQLDALQRDISTYEAAEFEDDFEEMDHLKTWTKKYADILSVNKMQYEIGLPNEVSEVQLYIGKDYDTMGRNLVAVNNRAERLEYDVYQDKSSNKFGVVDQHGAVIIPAKYALLERTGAAFFAEQTSDKIQTYRLDTAKKELTRLPEEFTFQNELSHAFYLFRNKDEYVGVMDKNLKEVVPFRFDGGALCGDVFVMTATHRGRPYKEFYTREGKQIPVPGKIVRSNCDGDYIMLTNREGKSGVLTKDGKLTVSPNYYIDERYGRLSDKLFAYQLEDERDARAGIINARTGAITVPVERGFDYIVEFSEGLAAADFLPGYDRQMGYIDEAGHIVISPKFLSATPFYKGLACVKAQDGKMYLINKKAEVIKAFPDSDQEGNGYAVENYGVQRKWHDLTYYNINRRYYDDQGSMLPRELITKIKNDD